METALAFVAFGVGWPVLIGASVWMWNKSTTLQGHAKTFFYVSLVSFYTLGYTCTVYWLNMPWVVGVLPAFVVFVILIVIMVRAFMIAERPAPSN